MSHFLAQELSPEGDSLQDAERIEYRDLPRWVWFRCPRMPANNLRHFIALACQDKNAIVDFNHWEGEGELRRMVWSARVRYEP